MSRPEVPELDEAEDRPAIGAARLEAMFDGLRREVATGVPAPDAVEVVRRGVRRRQRRRVGAVAGAGVLGAAALWTVATVVPLQSRHGVAGVPVEQSAAPLPKPSKGWASSAAPVPSFPAEPTPSGAASARVWTLLPLEGAEPEVRALALGVRRMPSVLGGYGPWTAVAPSTGASPFLSPSPSVSASASGAGAGASAAPSGGASGAGVVLPVPSSPEEEFADGCVAGLVARTGASRAWGETYTDGSRVEGAEGAAGTERAEEATAHQYVLDFGTPGAAKAAGARLLAGGGCVAPGAGWTVEDQGIGVVALGTRAPAPAAEEVAVHVTGSVVAVLTVRRSGDGVVPEAGLSDSFLLAAEEFLTLGQPTPTGSRAGSPTSSPTGRATG
ncbi:hypothetical protein Kpho02_44460 [Kitasatospora phosalacinea]|uniref:Uncharacterized protein n=1 Tax=Kitasatospora phosalacinea TaxID=2065 RepID=A0A9W6QCQ9_9ACTN|nr:hypothetical protein [Kitasatospora phosalacinea]GLW72147.1 hypothetical protein Kpho02_44460 [Kitasatospora phosalacinea]